MKSQERLSTGSEWSFELLEKYDREIGRLAEEHALDTYPNQIEVISALQMMDIYSAVGMPLGYHHWSFGKEYLNVEKSYKRGHMGLAYEIVINSNPCISYLMEENTIVLQAIVIAHACYGHNSFFKNNYLFKSWTCADAIIDYLVFAKNYLARCEEKYGLAAVEETLDSAHVLMKYGVDRYKHPKEISLHEEKERQRKREEYLQTQVNLIWRTLPDGALGNSEIENGRFPSEPQENLLYFIEKNAPLLESWQREIIRIVRKIAQYFYPQRQTKIMNEGWACFWHYTLINDLYDQGLVSNEFMMEFLQSHTNVVFQPPFDSPYFNGLNPYTLGYGIFTDIKRICENPTEEDKEWFPELAGGQWEKEIDFAMRNFKDESFIGQYLSPQLIRDMKLFHIIDDDKDPDLLIASIHNEHGYKTIRQYLAQQYNLSFTEPNIQVYKVDLRGDRSMTLRYIQNDRQPLGANSEEVLRHIHRLWGFTIRLESVDENGEITSTIICPPEKAETIKGDLEIK